MGGFMKFSEWILAREGAKVIPWGDKNAMVAHTMAAANANPHAQTAGQITEAPPRRDKKPVTPPPLAPPKKMKKA
jgi:hypothetical protein